MSENDSDLGAFLAGFVIGGLVGAATALILAPQSGEQMRSEIASRSRELRQTGAERMQQYREMADTYGHEYREKASQVFTDARSRLEETGGRVQEQARIVLDAGKEKVGQGKAEGDTPQPSSDEQEERPVA